MDNAYFNIASFVAFAGMGFYFHYSIRRLLAFENDISFDPSARFVHGDEKEHEDRLDREIERTGG